MIANQLMTATEFEAFLREPANRDRFLELFNGEIIETMPTEEHGQIALRIGSRLLAYLELHPIGHVGVEVRHRVPNDDYTHLRPVVSFRKTETPVFTEGAVPHLPDLAVEVKSPDDTYLYMRQKAQYYLAHGVTMVWLVYPRKRTIEVYHADADIEILQLGDTIQGGELLPNFELPVSYVLG